MLIVRNAYLLLYIATASRQNASAKKTHKKV